MMGSTRWLALVVAAIGCSPAVKTAPTPVAAPEQAEPRAATPGPMLWRVDGPAGPSYLFGTVHLGVGPRDIDPVVVQSLDACDIFVSETDLASIDPSVVINLGTLPEAESLQALLGDEHYAELYRQLGAVVPQLDRFRPWFAYVQIVQRLFPTADPLDRMLQRNAQDARKELVFLESAADQLALLSEIIDADDLKQILDPKSDERKTLLALVEAYKRGDFVTLEKLVASPEVIAQDPDEFEALFTRRNKAWIPALVKQLRRGKTFVAVGAGHYAGPTGLLALLEAEGFETRPVPASSIEESRVESRESRVANAPGLLEPDSRL
jgi:uncharacterized protein YbaP (TraB family)